QRVHRVTELDARPVTARNASIATIRDPSQQKEDQRGGEPVDPGRVERRDEKDGQDQPANGETVCPVHARTDEESKLRGDFSPSVSAEALLSLNTGCFQIGTVRLSSSMIHWLALKAAKR